MQGKEKPMLVLVYFPQSSNFQGKRTVDDFMFGEPHIGTKTSKCQTSLWKCLEHPRKSSVIFGYGWGSAKIIGMHSQNKNLTPVTQKKLAGITCVMCLELV